VLRGSSENGDGRLTIVVNCERPRETGRRNRRKTGEGQVK
jgi:hypothetical protein